MILETTTEEIKKSNECNKSQKLYEFIEKILNIQSTKCRLFYSKLNPHGKCAYYLINTKFTSITKIIDFRYY